MKNKKIYLALDIGERRIGVAVGDSIARLAQPIATMLVDDRVKEQLAHLLREHEVTDIVVGLPRNQSGESTAQTQQVRSFVAELNVALPLHWQDESVTSVLAEERLEQRKKAYTKADIDAEAAAIILQDFLEGALRHE